jgi:hypothetical protein
MPESGARGLFRPQAAVASRPAAQAIPAEIENQERQAKLAKAIESIDTDPFVRDLVENFDARVKDSSIKPIQ